MKLYFHPRSPYSQKTMIAFHEKQVAFTPVMVNLADAAARAEHRKLNPLGKVPVLLLDDGWKIPESSIIIEYLDTHYTTGPQLIPTDPDQGRQTRFHDRLADLYVSEAVTKIFFDSQRDPDGAAAAHRRLDEMFAAFDEHLGKRTWLMGDTFTLADCALLPGLRYGRTLHPFERWKNLSAYANRGFERPSFVKMEAELLPYLAQPKAGAA
jgi:glutathione S-transferase